MLQTKSQAICLVEYRYWELVTRPGNFLNMLMIKSTNHVAFTFLATKLWPWYITDKNIQKVPPSWKNRKMPCWFWWDNNIWQARTVYCCWVVRWGGCPLVTSVCVCLSLKNQSTNSKYFQLIHWFAGFLTITNSIFMAKNKAKEILKEITEN